MKSTNLIKSIFKLFAIVTIVLGITSFTVKQAALQKLSLDLMARTLSNGKSVTGYGMVYYSVKDGLLITKMKSPFDQYVSTSAIGEFKSYDFKTNSVTLLQGGSFSSKSSFLYTFLSGQISDMGLKSLGFKQTGSRIENGFFISIWSAPIDRATDASEVEIAYENSLPVYMGFYDLEHTLKQKTYYSNYQAVSYIQMPMTITEIAFISDIDSTITQRKYSNLKLNNEVSNEWFEFKIPANAKVLTTDAPSLIGQ